MYTFSSKLKTFSFVLMILGAIGIGIGFMAAPKTIEDVEKLLADSRNHVQWDREKFAPKPMQLSKIN